MGIFNFFSKREPELLTQEVQGYSKGFAFSTPFMRIGKGNLSSPHVNTYYTNAGGFVRFGSDNLYPQLLNQLYFQSALHGSAIDFINNAITGGGYTWKIEGTTGKEKVEIATFERRNNIKKLVKLISRDLLMHNRVTLLLTKLPDKTCSIKRLDPSTIRNNIDGVRLAWNPDWSRGDAGSKIYNRWTPECKDRESIFIYQENSPGQDIYPIPSYNSILNWAYLDAEQSLFHKQNIQNSVFPSIVIRRPKEFASQDEIDKFKEQLKMKQGAENSGSALVLTGQGFDDTPEVIFPNSNPNDKVFLETSKEIKDQICFAHKINPSIMGIKVAGSLGSAQELEMSYAIFEKNVIMPARRTLEEVLASLFDACYFNNEIVINDFQIIEKAVQEIQK